MKKRRRNKIKENKKNPSRQCISCRTHLTRDELIRITKFIDKASNTEKIIINPNKLQFGRSAYLCKKVSCINSAIKDKKVAKMLHVSANNLKTVMLELESFNSKLETPNSKLQTRNSKLETPNSKRGC